MYRNSMVCTEFSCLHTSVSPEILEFISTIQKLIRGSPALRQIKFIEFARHGQCHCELQWMKLHRGSWCNKPRLGVGASQSTTVCCLKGRERPLGAGSGLWWDTFRQCIGKDRLPVMGLVTVCWSRALAEATGELSYGLCSNAVKELKLFPEES